MKQLLTSIALGLLTAGAAQAQAWPTAKPVTLLVPFPPGGSTDLIARTLGPKLQERLGGTFVVENKAGAGGTVGAAQAKRSAPDGYTLFVSSLGPFVIGPHLIKNVAYDALNDFDYITVAVQAPNVLAVPAASPHKTLADVLAYKRANPGKMTMASSGNGSSDHLTAELFWQETGTSGVHVPYKGGAPAMADLLGGQVDATFMNINTGLQNIKAGKLRALAITSTRRSPLLPDVPTLEEAGIKGIALDSWAAVLAPAGTPPEIVNRLSTEIARIVALPDVRERLAALNYDPVGSTPAELGRTIDAEIAKWKRVVKEANYKAED